MTEYRVVNALTFTRSDPDEVVAIAGKRRITRLQDLRDGGGLTRTDIALVNLREAHCPTCTCGQDKFRIDRQTVVYVDKDGTPYGEGMQYLTDEQRAWCHDEGQRLTQIAAQHPEMGVYLR
jgi:hypothetical protein